MHPESDHLLVPVCCRRGRTPLPFPLPLLWLGLTLTLHPCSSLQLGDLNLPCGNNWEAAREVIVFSIWWFIRKCSSYCAHTPTPTHLHSDKPMCNTPTPLCLQVWGPSHPSASPFLKKTGCWLCCFHPHDISTPITRLCFDFYTEREDEEDGKSGSFRLHSQTCHGLNAGISSMNPHQPD